MRVKYARHSIAVSHQKRLFALVIVVDIRANGKVLPVMFDKSILSLHLVHVNAWNQTKVVCLGLL